MSKARITAPASNHIQSFEFISPHLLYKLHLHLESQPRLSSAQHLWGDLDSSVLIPFHSLTWGNRDGNARGCGGEVEPLVELLCQQNKLLYFCGPWRRELKSYFDQHCLYFVLKLQLNLPWLEPFQSFYSSLTSLHSQQWAGQCQHVQKQPDGNQNQDWGEIYRCVRTRQIRLVTWQQRIKSV